MRYNKMCEQISYIEVDSMEHTYSVACIHTVEQWYDNLFIIFSVLVKYIDYTFGEKDRDRVP